MRARLILKPGQRGTEKSRVQNGDRLLYVRYRYDEERRKRFKTMELIVDELGVATPGQGGRYDRRTSGRQEELALWIGWRERAVQRRVKSAGGRWDPVRRIWILRRNVAERLDLLLA